MGARVCATVGPSLVPCHPEFKSHYSKLILGGRRPARKADAAEGAATDTNPDMRGEGVLKKKQKRFHFAETEKV